MNVNLPVFKTADLNDFRGWTGNSIRYRVQYFLGFPVIFDGGPNESLKGFFYERPQTKTEAHAEGET